MALEIHSGAPEQGVLTVRLEGRLDSDTAFDLDHKLAALPAAEMAVLVLDLAGLDYMSSAGIRCLFTARMTMEQAGGRLILFRPQAPVRKVLDMVRIVEPSNVLDSHDQLEQSLA